MKNDERVVRGQARILTNTTYLLAASIIQKFISFGYFIYYARTIGPKSVGLFEPIRSVIPIALVIIDFALSVVLTREIARNQEKAKHYLNTVLSLKLLFAVATLLITFAVTAFTNFDQPTRTLLFIAGMIVAFDMFTMTYAATLRGIQIFRYEAIGIILTQLTTVLVGVIALNLKLGLPALMIALLGGSVVNFFFLLRMVRRRLGAFPKLAWDAELVKRFLLIAVPILGAQLIARLFTYADRYLLLSLADKTTTGIYLAAHRIPFALEFIPAAFAASLLPAMSNYFLHSREQLARAFHQAFRYLILLSVPLVVGIFVLAQPFVIKLLKQAYSDSITPLRIMIIALPLIFLNFPAGHFLIATNRQIWNTINMGLAVVTNIVLNLALIPRLGANGAALSVVVSYVMLFTLNMIQVRRVMPLRSRDLIAVIIQSLAAAAIMGVAIGFLQRMFSPYFLILPGAVIYVAALFILGTVKFSDVRLLLEALGRKTS